MVARICHPNTQKAEGSEPPASLGYKAYSGGQYEQDPASEAKPNQNQSWDWRWDSGTVLTQDTQGPVSCSAPRKQTEMTILQNKWIVYVSHNSKLLVSS